MVGRLIAELISSSLQASPSTRHPSTAIHAQRPVELHVGEEAVASDQRQRVLGRIELLLRLQHFVVASLLVPLDLIDRRFPSGAAKSPRKCWIRLNR